MLGQVPGLDTGAVLTVYRDFEWSGAWTGGIHTCNAFVLGEGEG